MNLNYNNPWEISLLDSIDNLNPAKQLEYIASFGLLAPSGHNSQPWEIKIEENLMHFSINAKRSLSESDPIGRQLGIAIGCFLENIEAAANNFGYESIYTISWEKYPALEGTLKLQKKPYENNIGRTLISAILKRATDRFKYEKRTIPQEILNNLSESSDSGIHLHFVTDIMDKTIKDELGTIMIEAQVEAMDSDKFREELSHFIISNYSKKKTGMPGFALGLPGPVSVIASHLIKHVNVSKLSKNQDLDIITNHTPAIGVMTCSQDTPQSWLQAGKIFQHLWLKATNYNLHLSPLAAAVQISNFKERVKNTLKIGSEPIVLFRIGYSKNKTYHSPRIQIQEYIHKNF